MVNKSAILNTKRLDMTLPLESYQLSIQELMYRVDNLEEKATKTSGLEQGGSSRVLGSHNNAHARSR